jgi:hypothetical protein
MRDTRFRIVDLTKWNTMTEGEADNNCEKVGSLWPEQMVRRPNGQQLSRFVFVPCLLMFRFFVGLPDLKVRYRIPYTIQHTAMQYCSDIRGFREADAGLADFVGIFNGAGSRCSMAGGGGKTFFGVITSSPYSTYLYDTSDTRHRHTTDIAVMSTKT